MNKIHILSLLVATLCLQIPAEASSQIREGEILVRIDPAREGENLKSELSVLLNELNAEEIRQLRGFPEFRLIRLKGKVSMKKALNRLSITRGISYAEPNYIYSINNTLEDARIQDKKFKFQWALANTGQSIGRERYEGTPGADIDIARLWAENPETKEAASGVVVAVIDTGIGLHHKDLKGNLWRNPGENGSWTPSGPSAAFGCKDKRCNGIDDDGNGYIDDYQGWNWSVQWQDGGTNSPDDDNNHGSHVAGTIGAIHDVKGVVGINAKVQLMPLKFLDKKGNGDLASAIDAIAYAMNNGADVINASWGGTEKSQALADAIQAAVSRGVLFVAAAGNNAANNDQTPSYPANYGFDGLISVVASDMWDGRANFSNYGRAKTHVAAPGFEIISTVVKNGPHAFFSGTSMASPHVAGLAALVIGTNPEFKGKPAALRQRLLDTSEILPDLAARSLSGGRINAYNAVKGIVPVGHTQPEAGASSTLLPYAFESEHPYMNESTTEYTIAHPGAKWIRVHFGKHSIENFGDRLEIYDKEGNLFDVFTGFGNQAQSRAVKGDEVRLILKTDRSVNGWGFEVTGYEFFN